MDAAVMTNNTSNAPAAPILARFAAALHFDDIPAPAVERATHCLVDAVACAIYGAKFPWSRIVMQQTGLRPESGFLPVSDAVRDAALVWGTRAHAFELDSLCRPSAGVHPGATVALPALAMAQARGSSGRDLLRAIVAGCEVMFRIGTATRHTPEKRGFHAPGLNGPFGSAIACGTLMGLSASQLTNALGIAGSLGAGLLAFSKAGRGGMVKRLHMGRAAEAGVLAAQLAADGFEGPDTVLDGTFGFLQAVCDGSDPSLLTADIARTWKIETLCLKQFACHITAHAPVQLLRTLMQQHGFTGDDIAGMTLGVSEKVLSHHTSRNPMDIMQAQYSVPYITAIAAYRDISDPENFSDDVLADPKIRRIAEGIALTGKRGDAATGWGVEMSVRLRNGRVIEEVLDSFVGCPDAPFSLDRLREKFRTLTKSGAVDADGLFSSLASIENLGDVRRLWAA
ncbi:MAG TPA: MmgE/PrpD family protein [Dongiaceae bacterium]